ncbi:MAG: hypothetical protein IMZ61_16470, partial [Planctomycetes bacterium]|nr:hypothetical protein [Planctomycetota bacterium]
MNMRDVKGLRTRAKQGIPIIGADVQLGSTLSAEVFSMLGLDFVLVDNQHGLWDQQSTYAAFRCICMGSAVPIARVEQNDYYAIGNLLDKGALGIVVPQLETAEQARCAALAARYPPRGCRS